MNDLGALTPCAGFVGDLATTQIYRIAGYSPTASGGVEYAWSRVDG
jgi:hypothetical protein